MSIRYYTNSYKFVLENFLVLCEIFNYKISNTLKFIVSRNNELSETFLYENFPRPAHYHKTWKTKKHTHRSSSWERWVCCDSLPLVTEGELWTNLFSVFSDYCFISTRLPLVSI